MTFRLFAHAVRPLELSTPEWVLAESGQHTFPSNPTSSMGPSHQHHVAQSDPMMPSMFPMKTLVVGEMRMQLSVMTKAGNDSNECTTEASAVKDVQSMASNSMTALTGSESSA